MPSLYYRVEAPGVNILKTVTDQVVLGLLNEFDMSEWFKDAIYIQQSFSAYSNYDDGNGAPNVNKNRCDVEVQYIMDKSQVLWPTESPYDTTAYGLRSTRKGNYTPILIDTDSNILIEQMCIACGINLDFSLNFQTFDDATKAFDTIQAKYKGSLVQTPFDLAFSYPVSYSLFKFLVAVASAKKDYVGKTVLDYIDDKKITDISFDVRKSQLTDPNADKELTIKFQQLNAVGLLTMDQSEPDVQRVDELSDSFKINFKYQFQFARPTIIAVHTPVAVDNTVLPPSLFSSVTTNYHFSPDVSGVFSDRILSDYASRSYGNFNNSAQIFRTPVYDDWFSYDRQYAVYQYRPFLIAHFTLDGDITTIDLNQLGDLGLHPVVKSILKETGNNLFNYGGLFHIGVFADDLRLGTELVSIDENLILTIRSSKPNRNYHFVISETTNLKYTDPSWDRLLVKYRYFFPMTIERNLNSLIKKHYFYIAYDDAMLNLISKLAATGKLSIILNALIQLGEATYEIYGYTQNAAQLADYLAYTQSARMNYTIPKTDPNNPNSPDNPIIAQFYQTIASVEGRSLFIAFIEQCLLNNYIDLDQVPMDYLRPNKALYPYVVTPGGLYGFNTPLRVLTFDIRPERRRE